MVLIRTESNRFTTNGSFREIINEFQDRNIKEKTLGLLNEKYMNK